MKSGQKIFGECGGLLGLGFFGGGEEGGEVFPVLDEVAVVHAVAGVDGVEAGVIPVLVNFGGNGEAHEFEFGLGGFFDENIDVFGVFELVGGDDEVWIFGGGGFDFNGVGLAVEEEGAVAGVGGGGAALGVVVVGGVVDVVLQAPFFPGDFPLGSEAVSVGGFHFFKIPGHGFLVFFVFLKSFVPDEIGGF